MRKLSLALPVILLTGCITQDAQPETTAMVAAPFDVPMDPGQISCADLRNPTALAAATDWAMGQARAAVMSGQRTGLLEQSALSAQLANACAGNTGTVRSALGLV